VKECEKSRWDNVKCDEGQRGKNRRIKLEDSGCGIEEQHRPQQVVAFCAHYAIVRRRKDETAA
jgi:hypothetical protein